mgnify:CR=1 FL=1
MYVIPKFFINFAPNKSGPSEMASAIVLKVLQVTNIPTHNTTQYSIYYYD